MEKDRWEKVAALYQAALDHLPAERDAFLEAHCEDADLRHEAHSLLSENVSRDGVLESVAALAEFAGLPSSVGPYRVTGRLGEGGMGVVYRAEQAHPRRTVALKVVKPGLDIPAVLRRFEQESNALGRLQHPGIARIYDAGFAGGRPYFAMELIDGPPLLEYARVQRLGTAEKVELAIKICEATHHAHERGIIHRDLKPTNILVDATGQPKILDFGVARVVDHHNPEETKGGLLVGTLQWMSPEHVSGEAIDARSDVYSLGLILYELLSGRAAYVTGRKMEEALEVILRQDPPRLGTIRRELKGDLEIIAAKALDKDRNHRYASALDMAEDLRRVLLQQPISARAAGWLYATRKLALRNPQASAGLLIVFAVLLAGIAASLWQASRARQAEKVAQAVVQFLRDDILAQAGGRSQTKGARPDPDLKIRTALDRAAAGLDLRFAGQPEVEASLRQTIGNAYRELGLYTEAIRHLERALELANAEGGEPNALALEIMTDLGALFVQAGNLEAAERTLSRALDVQLKRKGETHERTLAIRSELATVVGSRGDFTGAARLLNELLTAEIKVNGERHPDALAIMNNLAAHYTNLGQFSQAASLYRRAVDIKSQVMGASHPSTLLSMNSLAVVYRNQGKYGDAERLLIHAWTERRKSLGEEHPDTVASLISLALCYDAQGNSEAAGPLIRQAVETSRRLRPGHPDTLRVMVTQADHERSVGRAAPAETLLREALELARPKGNPTIVANALSSLGGLMFDAGRFAEAEPCLREAIQLQEKTGTDDWRLFYNQAQLGVTLASLGRRAEGAALLADAHRNLLRKQEFIPFHRRTVLKQSAEWIQRFR